MAEEHNLGQSFFSLSPAKVENTFIYCCTIQEHIIKEVQELTETG